MAATRFRPRSDPSSFRGEESAPPAATGDLRLPWHAHGRQFGVMGVLNATPDSFHAPSRVGARLTECARRMFAEGVDVFDVGGESTRPGAQPVSASQELDRVLPVIEHLRSCHPDVPVSIDTYKAEVAKAAIDAGACIVNDVTGGLLDPALPRAVAAGGAVAIIGHIRGTPATMLEAPGYDDVVAEVRVELSERIDAFRNAGVPQERLWIDPGIGFGKRAPASRTLLFGLAALGVLGCPIVIGVSRKSFLRVALEDAGLGESTSEERLEASLAGAVIAAERGAVLVRTHDVGPTRRALALLEGSRG